MERHEQLRSRVVDDRVSIAWMARRLNVAQSSAAALLGAERMSVKRHGRLARIGMPEEFLPGAEDAKRPGRPCMVPVREQNDHASTTRRTGNGIRLWKVSQESAVRL